MEKKIKRLPKSPNGKKRKSASLACWSYQKQEIQRRAYKRGMSVSYYLNTLLFKDWQD